MDGILRSIIDSGYAWVSPDYLAETLNYDVADELAELDTEDMVTVWDSPDGVVVTLTPTSADKLGVHLVETNIEGRYRWTSIGDPLPSPPRAKNVATRGQAGRMEWVIDESTPEISDEFGALSAMPLGERHMAIRAMWQGFRKYDENCLPYPTSLLGAGMAMWDNVKHDVCPGCLGRPLKAHEICLRCDRWGLDFILDGKRRTMPVKIRGFRQKPARTRNGIPRKR